jgi:hypothetical protein
MFRSASSFNQVVRFDYSALVTYNVHISPEKYVHWQTFDQTNMLSDCNKKLTYEHAGSTGGTNPM